MRSALRTGLVGIFAMAFVMVTIIWSAADEIPACRLVPTGVSVITRLDDAAPSLVRALTERIGEIVPVDAPFDPTDVVRIGKSRRLIFIWNRGTRWVVATEHGGLAYNFPVFAFEIDRDDEKAILVRQETAGFPNEVCSTASSLLVIGYPPYVRDGSATGRTRP